MGYSVQIQTLVKSVNDEVKPGMLSQELPATRRLEARLSWRAFRAH